MQCDDDMSTIMCKIGAKQDENKWTMTNDVGGAYQAGIHASWISSLTKSVENRYCESWASCNGRCR